jgi:signal transduction histidine kinase/ActR/RegA family two-component response regulator
VKTFRTSILPRVPVDLVSAMDQEVAQRARYTSLSMSAMAILATHMTGLMQEYAGFVATLLVVVLLFSALRMWLSFRFEKLYARSPRLWIAGNSVSVLVPAALTGAGLALLITREGASWNTMVCLSNATVLAAGSAMSMSCQLPLFYAYINLLLMPPALALTRQSTDPASWVAILVLLCMVQVSIFARYTHKAALERIRNQRLLEKRAAALEKANQEVLAANAAKNEFLGNMSHELRTPLNGILGLAELLMDTPLQDRQARYLVDLRTSGQKLMKTITQVLDFSRLERGDWDLHPTRFSLVELLRSLQAEGNKLAQSNGNLLQLEVDEDLPAQMVGDAPAISQILTRLLENALHHTQRGEVTVRARMHHRADGLVALSLEVQDSGPGIPAERHEAIFQAFDRDKADGQDAEPGTGLGLATSRQLANFLGGRLTLQSELGQGSTFTLWLTLPEYHEKAPRTAAVEAPLPAPAAPAAAGACQKDTGNCLKGLRVLLVEDNTVNAKLTTRILEKSHVEVTWVVNGKDAINAFMTEKVDIVLMDIQMPVLDGFAATKAIRELERDTGGRVPIIAVTAHAMPGYREKCLIGGMDDYVTKPLNPGVLRETLIHWVPERNPAG